ncbi:MAG: c-type cytochrome [Oligoflexia bacterium]|nr:c-type cytochrome [Oligoflexia bacterium]
MDTKETEPAARHHHILPTFTTVLVGLSLLVLTGVTILLGGVELGRLNFAVAVLIASVKALLVALFFMNLLYDRRENSVIFGASFLFLAIFFVLTATDLFFRGDVAVKGPISAPVPAGGKRVAKPWLATEALVGRGRELFSQQCVTCHGPEGKGNGPAAASLTPRPRDFTATVGWKNGRKPSQILKTLNEGIPGSAMAAYTTLPPDDRWALAHFVVSLGPAAEKDSPEDLLKVGVDVAKGEAVIREAPSIPIELAMRRLTRPELKARTKARTPSPTQTPEGARVYQARCERCHGPEGEGAIVGALGGVPRMLLRTGPLSISKAIENESAFSEVVVRGLTGELMPGAADLSERELRGLYRHVQELSGRP